MKVASVLVLTACLLALGAPTVRAFELEGFGGFYRYDGSLAEEFQGDNAPVFGVRFGSGARQIVSGETTIGYGPGDDMNILLLMGNFLINIPVDPVVPFVTLGTGTTIYLPADAATAKEIALDTETKFTLNYGGGFRYFLNGLVAARLDVRDYITFDLDFNEKDAVSGQNPIDVGTIHNMVISGGLSLVF
jgi:hypothetical protein